MRRGSAMNDNGDGLNAKPQARPSSSKPSQDFLETRSKAVDVKRTTPRGRRVKDNDDDVGLNDFVDRTAPQGNRGRARASHDDDDFEDLERHAKPSGPARGRAHASNDDEGFDDLESVTQSMQPRGRSSHDDDAFNDLDSVTPSVVQPRGRSSHDDDAFNDLESVQARPRSSNDDDGFNDLESMQVRGRSSHDDDAFNDLESVTPSVVQPRGRSSHDDDAFNDLESVTPSVVQPRGRSSHDDDAFNDLESVQPSVKPRGRTNASEDDDSFGAFGVESLRPFVVGSPGSGSGSGSGGFGRGDGDDDGGGSLRSGKTLGSVGTLGTAMSALSSGGISKGNEQFTDAPSGKDKHGRTYYFNPMTGQVAWTREELASLVESQRGQPPVMVTGVEAVEDEGEMDPELAAAIAAGAAAAAAAEVEEFPLPPLAVGGVAWQSPGARVSPKGKPYSPRHKSKEEKGSASPRSAESTKGLGAKPRTPSSKSSSARDAGEQGGDLARAPAKGRSPKHGDEHKAGEPHLHKGKSPKHVDGAPPRRSPKHGHSADENSGGAFFATPRSSHSRKGAVAGASAAAAATRAATPPLPVEASVSPPLAPLPASGGAGGGSKALASSSHQAPSSGSSAFSMRSVRRRDRVEKGLKGQSAFFTDSEDDDDTKGGGGGDDSDSDDESLHLPKPPPPRGPRTPAAARRAQPSSGAVASHTPLEAVAVGDLSKLTTELAGLIAATRFPLASQGAAAPALAPASSRASQEEVVSSVRRGSLASHGWFALELFDLEEYPTSGGASGLYLDVHGASKRKGAALIAWPAGGGDLVGSGGVYNPASPGASGGGDQNGHGSGGNGVSGGGNGWPACPPENQLWRHDEATGSLVSGLSSGLSGGGAQLVADVSRSSCEPGAKLVTWTATAKANQVFEIGPVVSLLTAAAPAAPTNDATAAAAGLQGGGSGGGGVSAGLLVELVCAGLPFDDHGRGRALVLGVKSDPARRYETSHNLPSHRVHGGPVGAGAEVVTVHPADAASANDESHRPRSGGRRRAANGKFLTTWRVVPVGTALRPSA